MFNGTADKFPISVFNLKSCSKYRCSECHIICTNVIGGDEKFTGEHKVHVVAILLSFYGTQNHPNYSSYLDLVCEQFFFVF